MTINQKNLKFYGNWTDEAYDDMTDYGLFKFKARTKGITPATVNTNDVEIAMILKYLSNFWKTLEMLLINSEINLILTSYENCVITDWMGGKTFAINNEKVHVSVVTPSI